MELRAQRVGGAVGLRAPEHPQLVRAVEVVLLDEWTSAVILRCHTMSVVMRIPHDECCDANPAR
eukprot:SAG11_NODE_3720_length_2261_cov_3.429232_3_plen_63_part_01